MGTSEAVCTACSPAACPRTKKPDRSAERCSGDEEYPFPSSSLLMLEGRRLSTTVSGRVNQVSYRSPLAPKPKRILPSTSYVFGYPSASRWYFGKAAESYAPTIVRRAGCFVKDAS